MKTKISNEVLIEELKTKSPNEIAALYGYHPNGLRTKIRKLGIKRSKHEHLINHNYFKTWSADMAYILGFVFADGSINTHLHHNQLRIELKSTDVEVLEFIRSKIQPTKNIQYYSRIHKKTGKVSHSAFLCFSSKEIVNDLKDLGCIENKTYEEIRVPNIPIEYMPDFIRGNFDGDGSINSKKDNIRDATFTISCSSISFLNDVKTIIKFGIIDTKENPPRLNIFAHNELIEIYNLIYNGSFCLKRKFDRYTKIVNVLKIPHIRKIRKDKRVKNEA